MALRFLLPTEMRMNGDIVQGEKATVDTKPEVGAIAWSTEGYYGHVAWVSNVSGIRLKSKSITMGFEKSIIVEKSRLVR